MKPISVLIVDDHPLFRQGVAGLVEDAADMFVAGQAATGREAIAACRDLQPDVVVMDLQMPAMGGVEATAVLRSEAPNARVIVLTTFEGDVHASKALNAGAAAFMLKSTAGDELVDAIRAVHAGKRRITPSVAVAIASNLTSNALSEREVQVLELVSRGKSNRLIGAQLAISEDTVKAHLKSVFAKLQANDRTHAVTLAIERGIIELHRHSD
ncbi:response regulator [Pseudoduganella plicata]|uniref:DNA-binding response regulator n=1 Tax=Pseudoduganella plicata TaxID=321984 RepID=A0A4P7BG25_9BURK|nr:response regulator transcription factor [Pseudoduganella plicata]QBQ37726.1 response regulator transcription factor [Pseudoduganella plicata]GGY92651.1 DNA-binding response regulator [Pseudoduganella plicata]